MEVRHGTGGNGLASGKFDHPQVPSATQDQVSDCSEQTYLSVAEYFGSGLDLQVFPLPVAVASVGRADV